MHRQPTTIICATIPPHCQTSAKVATKSERFHRYHPALSRTSSDANDQLSDDMDASPLGTLPGELRNRIYELVLVKPTPIVLDFSIAGTKWPTGLDTNALALTATCKQIRGESVHLFSSRNTFVLDLGDNRDMYGRTSLNPPIKVHKRFRAWLQRAGLQKSFGSPSIEVRFQIFEGYSSAFDMTLLSKMIVDGMAMFEKLGR